MTETESERVMVTPRQIVIIPQCEQPVRRFTGLGGHLELYSFIEDVELVWAQRPRQSDLGKAAFLWSHLERDVRKEIACQGVDRRNKDALLQALRETYMDARSLSTPSLTFYSTRQESREDIRQFSARLHSVCTDLNKHRERENITLEDEACLKVQFIEGVKDNMVSLSLRQFSLANPDASFQKLRETVL